jgi:hypothetical protein
MPLHKSVRSLEKCGPDGDITPIQEPTPRDREEPLKGAQ